MADTVHRVVGDTITMGVMLTRRGIPVTGETISVELRRLSDGRYFDWTTLVWSTSPTGDKEDNLTEKTWLPGFYTKSWDHSVYDPDNIADYTAIYRNAVAPNQFTVVEIYSFNIDWSVAGDAIADEVWTEQLADHLSVAGSAAEQVAIIRGMVQQNYSLDQTTYNSLGLLLAGRLRLWTEASKVPATGGGSETDGLIATYNITTTPKPTNQDMVDYYKVVKA